MAIHKKLVVYCDLDIYDDVIREITNKYGKQTTLLGFAVEGTEVCEWCGGLGYIDAEGDEECADCAGLGVD